MISPFNGIPCQNEPSGERESHRASVLAALVDFESSRCKPTTSNKENNRNCKLRSNKGLWEIDKNKAKNEG